MDTQANQKADTQTKLHVRSQRDEPPVGDWCARAIFLAIHDWELQIATVFDKDPRKLVRVLPGGRQKIRMRISGGKTKDETPLMTVCAEVHEECGVTEDFLDQLDFYPVCTVQQEGRIRRDTNDKATDDRGTDVQHIFARWGHVELHETDDLDAENPLWMSFSEIVEGVKNKVMGEVYWIYHVPAPGGETKEISVENGVNPPKDAQKVGERRAKNYLCMSHFVMLSSALQLIGKEFQRYTEGELSDECDLAFFGAIGREAKKNINDFYRLSDLMSVLTELDIVSELTEIVGDAEKAKNLLGAYTIKHLGGNGYFVS